MRTRSASEIRNVDNEKEKDKEKESNQERRLKVGNESLGCKG